MQTELSAKDQALLTELSERVAKLETIIYTGATLEQPPTISYLTTPAEPKEEYVELKCTFSDFENFTVGNKYNATLGELVKERQYYKAIDDNGDKREVVLNGSIWKFELAQQGEKEWKEGEWAKHNSEHKQNRIGLIKGFDKEVAYISLENGTPTQKWDIELLTEPTPKEVGKWLTSIAEKKYPVGTKVKCGDGFETISTTEFYYDEVNKDVAVRIDGKPHSWFIIWNAENKWAEISDPTVDSKERWKPSKGETFYYITPDLLIDVDSYRETIDFGKYEAGNCFKTQKLAQSAADKIRNLLINC